MLSSINPLVERGRNNRFWLTATAHIVGSTLGGMVSGAVAGALGALATAWLDPSEAAVAVAVLVLAVAGLAFDVPLPGLRLPSWHRQVNEDWMARYRGWVYGAGFGFQLGMGVVTIVTSSSVYVALGLAALTGDVAAGTLIGATFGLVRGLTVLSMAGVDDGSQLRRAHRRLQDGLPWARRVVLGTESLVAAAALVVLVGVT